MFLVYLDVPSSAITPTDIQLMFNFQAVTTATRAWNIKIALLPCGASYLGEILSSIDSRQHTIIYFSNLIHSCLIAPADCLQYFTAASGRVRSFNWQDVATTTTRQLNSQRYNICFRTELISGSVGILF